MCIAQLQPGTTTNSSFSSSPASSSSGGKAGLVSFKPSSQLMKPGAMTNHSSSKPAVAAAAGVSTKTAAVAAAGKMSNTDARNKLAMFKAQVQHYSTVHFNT